MKEVPQRTRIELCTADWPVVVLSPPPSVTDAQFDDLLERWEHDVAGRNEPFVLVLNVAGTNGITPTQRKRLACRRDDRNNLGTALVFTSAIIRGMLTALLWMRNPNHPVKVFATLESAVAWARERSVSDAYEIV